MGLEEVKEEILNSARNDTNKIIEEAKIEAQQILAKATKRISDYNNKLKEDKKKLIENLEKMKIAQARSEAKKLILDKKKEIIDDVFEKAKQKLASLSETKRGEYIQKLIEKAKNEMETATVYCNKKDKQFIGDFNYQETDIIGGVIVENQDGSVRIDYSFETMLNNVKEASLQKISKILF